MNEEGLRIHTLLFLLLLRLRLLHRRLLGLERFLGSLGLELREHLLVLRLLLRQRLQPAPLNGLLFFAALPLEGLLFFAAPLVSLGHGEGLEGLLEPGLEGRLGLEPHAAALLQIQQRPLDVSLLAEQLLVRRRVRLHRALLDRVDRIQLPVQRAELLQVSDLEDVGARLGNVGDVVLQLLLELLLARGLRRFQPGSQVVEHLELLLMGDLALVDHGLDLVVEDLDLLLQVMSAVQVHQDRLVLL
mmetsp:Transcript_107954/g.311934  ORF Transcript_107954/g.311934 Transcript_107954/m.311934 type:complete len:245 (-) Transcript_107954:302-1036(-)